MNLDAELDNILFDLQTLYPKISEKCSDKENVLKVIDILRNVEHIWDKEDDEEDEY